LNIVANTKLKAVIVLLRVERAQIVVDLRRNHGQELLLVSRLSVKARFLFKNTIVVINRLSIKTTRRLRLLSLEP
jgi:hypothetical protein